MFNSNRVLKVIPGAEGGEPGFQMRTPTEFLDAGSGRVSGARTY
jgi:hypothetical protein